MITGAAGLIGFNTVKMFADKGWRVLAVVHKNIKDELYCIKNVKVIKADVTNETSVNVGLKDIKPHVIIHCAGLASDIGNDNLFRKTNYESVKILAKLAREKFIFISSTDVYGIKDFHGEEEHELGYEKNPQNPYPKYKIKAEKWLRRNLEASKYVILRPGAVWGENDFSLEKRVVDFLKISPFFVYFGKWRGKNRWPLVDVKNLAETVLRVCECNDFDSQAINVVDENRVSIKEYYEIIAHKHFPKKRFYNLFLPLWTGKLLGWVSTGLSNSFNLTSPLFDPTAYSVLHISHNLDFSSKKLNKLLNPKINC